MENINTFIDGIKRLNDLAGSKSKYIILLNEIEISGDHYDLSDLKLHLDDIDLLMAINPSSTFSLHNSKVKLPQDSNSIIEQLRSKHRYSTEIGVFNLHLTMASDKYDKSWDWSKDEPLEESTFPSGRYPLLILVAEGLPDEVLLDSINEYLMPNNQNDLVLIIDYELNGERKHAIEDICNTKSWKVLESHDMTGSEAAVTVLFHLKDDLRSFEYHSRARNLLIIVQEYVNFL